MNDLVIVRGGGDIATGSIQKLHRVGFKVLVLEIENPTCIRRTVSCAEAIYSKYYEIEDLKIIKVNTVEEMEDAWDRGKIPIVADEDCHFIDKLKPLAVVDAILAKKNLGTNRNMAPITIGLGPGFEAGVDVDVVIETNRGHNLGRLIFRGLAEANTGNPGNVQGYTTERILRASDNGKIKVIKDLGSIVKKNEIVAYVNKKPVLAQIDGIVRGMIKDGTNVYKNMKIGDIGPRTNVDIHTISDKARAIGGNVLEALLILKNSNKEVTHASKNIK